MYHTYERRLQLDEHLRAIYSTGNGNCYYNSLSYIFFGDEQLWFIIKICSVYILFKNETYFRESSISFEVTFENLVESSCKRFAFARDLIIISSEIMLNRNVLIYNQSKNANLCVLYCFSQRNELNPIILGLLDLHFFPVLSFLDYFEYRKPHKEVIVCEIIGIRKIKLT